MDEFDLQLADLRQVMIDLDGDGVPDVVGPVGAMGMAGPQAMPPLPQQRPMPQAMPTPQPPNALASSPESGPTQNALMPVAPPELPKAPSYDPTPHTPLTTQDWMQAHLNNAVGSSALGRFGADLFGMDVDALQKKNADLQADRPWESVASSVAGYLPHIAGGVATGGLGFVPGMAMAAAAEGIPSMARNYLNEGTPENVVGNVAQGMIGAGVGTAVSKVAGAAGNALGHAAARGLLGPAGQRAVGGFRVKQIAKSDALFNQAKREASEIGMIPPTPRAPPRQIPHQPINQFPSGSRPTGAASRPYGEGAPKLDGSIPFPPPPRAQALPAGRQTGLFDPATRQLPQGQVATPSRQSGTIQGSHQGSAHQPAKVHVPPRFTSKYKKAIRETFAQNGGKITPAELKNITSGISPDKTKAYVDRLKTIYDELGAEGFKKALPYLAGTAGLAAALPDDNDKTKWLRNPDRRSDLMNFR